MATRGNTKAEHKATIQRCNALLKENPRDAAALRQRAEAKRKLGQAQEAVADFTTSLAIDPSSPVALAGRGSALRGLHRHTEAIHDYNAALGLQPTNAIVLIGRGSAKRDLGRAKEAVADFDAALKLQPKSPYALQLRGEIRRKLKHYPLAIADFNAALKEQPTYAAALAGRGAAKRSSGLHLEALSDYDAAISIDPRNAPMLSGRATVKLELGRFEDALRDFQFAIRVDPNDSYASWGLREASLQIRKLLKVLLLEGFKWHSTNMHFVERRDPEFAVNGRETFWSVDEEHFLYWCSKETRWKGSRAADLSKTRNGSTAGVFAAPVGTDLFDPSLLKGWHEWDGLAWKLRPNAGIGSVDRTDVPRKTFTLSGFGAVALNTTFVERLEPELSVNDRATYWSPDDKFFLFWCKASSRWKGTRAEEWRKIKKGSTAAVFGAPIGEMLFAPTHRKAWHEWDGGAWHCRPHAGIVSIGLDLDSSAQAGLHAPEAKRQRRT